MKYITYFSCFDDAWHIKEIDASKTKRFGTTSFTYIGMIYNSPLYDNKEQAYQSRELKFTSNQIIED